LHVSIIGEHAVPKKKRPAKQAKSQHKATESSDAHDGAQGWDYYTTVNPKGLDKLVARNKVDPELVQDLLSELYDLSIRGESLHGGRKAIIKLLQPIYPELDDEDRGYYLLRHLIDKPKRGGSTRP